MSIFHHNARGGTSRLRIINPSLSLALLALAGCTSARPAPEVARVPVAPACGEVIEPPGKGTRWAQVVSTARSSCALSEAGQVVCWGDGRAHQLGVGAPGYRHVPAALCARRTFTRLVASVEDVCGLSASGEAWCWGARFGEVPQRWAPQHTFEALALSEGVLCGQVAGGALWCSSEVDGAPRRQPFDARALGASQRDVCALTSEARVMCMSQPRLRRGHPREVMHGGAPLVSLTSGVGQHQCGLTAGGELWCWGSNTRGQLGQSWRQLASSHHKTVRVETPAGARWASATTGRAHTCAIDDAGRSWCWGANRDLARAPYGGQLGTGDLADRDQPAGVRARAPFSQLAAGGAHTCGLTAQSKQVQCWGDDSYGQTGDGPARVRALPLPRLQRITWPKGVTMQQVQGRRELICALDAQAQVWCASQTLPLRSGTRPDPRRAELPMLMMGVPGKVAQLATGDAQACALTDQDEVYCWGDNHHAHVRAFASSHPISSPTRISLGKIQTLRLVWSGGQMCALDVDRRLWCWGTPHITHGPVVSRAGGGRPGHEVHVGRTPYRDPMYFRRTYQSVKPAQLGVGVQIAEIAGDLIVDTSGVVYIHERSRPGMLRRITRPGQSWRRVAASAGHACALDAQGRAWCWGRGDEGQLGDGVLHAREVPAAQPVMARAEAQFTEVYAFEGVSCALTAEGQAWCWGRNLHGELGARVRSAPVATPVPVATRARFASLHASEDHLSRTLQQLCGLSRDGAALCWGMGQSKPAALAPVHTFRALLAVGRAGLGLSREAPMVVRWSWQQPQRFIHAPANQTSPITIAPATRP